MLSTLYELLELKEYLHTLDTMGYKTPDNMPAITVLMFWITNCQTPMDSQNIFSLIIFFCFTLYYETCHQIHKLNFHSAAYLSGTF